MTAYVKLKTTNCELYENDSIIEENNQLQEKKEKQENSMKEKCKKKLSLNLLKKYLLEFVVFIKYWFHIITIKQIHQADIFIFPFQQKEDSNSFKKMIYQYQMKKCVQKFKKLVKKYQITTIILSDGLKKDKDFLREFSGKAELASRHVMLNEKKLFPYMILEIIEYILGKGQRKLETTDIYILIHEKKQDYIDNILFLLPHFKTINIVTDNLRAFQRLAEEIEEKQGILITVSNNTRKSLRNAKLIINFDFLENEMRKYSIYRKSVIIQVPRDLSYENQAFNGIQVQNIEIDISKEIKEFFANHYLLGEYSLINLYEGTIPSRERFNTLRKRIEEEQVRIVSLYGKNGRIDEKEFESVESL